MLPVHLYFKDRTHCNAHGVMKGTEERGCGAPKGGGVERSLNEISLISAETAECLAPLTPAKLTLG